MVNICIGICLGYLLHDAVSCFLYYLEIYKHVDEALHTGDESKLTEKEKEILKIIKNKRHF